MDVLYPPSLPAPQPGSLAPRPRRAASSMEGPLQQRARQRDAAGLASQYTYTYTPEQMAAWLAWWRDELLQGRRWFAHDLPGRAGLMPRVVRYRDVQQQLLGVGIYRVSASFEQRGASVAPLEGSSYEVDINGITNAGTSSAVGVTLSGLDPALSYVITQPDGRLYGAWRAIPSDGNWENGRLKATSTAGTSTHGSPAATYYATQQLARNAFNALSVGSRTITGAASYTFWILDPPNSDNAGGLSLLISSL